MPGERPSSLSSLRYWKHPYTLLPVLFINNYLTLLMEKTSALPGFYKKSVEERLSVVAEFAGLSDDEEALLKKTGSLELSAANHIIENVTGTMELPFGVATNFRINGRDYLIPMALEEPSVVAAASYGAKLCRPVGFKASADKSIMKSMVQLVGIENVEKAAAAVLEEKKKLIKLARNPDSSLVKLGGGVFDIVPRSLDTKRGRMLIVDIFSDCKNAMGANTVNTAAETLAPRLEELSGGKKRLMIISNLADQRLARAEAIWTDLDDDLIEGILDAYEFAEADPYRCSTHNKGIMNGIDAVALATGNDFRALEAGAHAYAMRNRRYQSLTTFEKTPEGLLGRIELPLAVGIVGGSTKTNRIAQIALKILGISTAQSLAEIMAAVGLAQNFATLRAQVAEGLQAGHMKLHATNLAVSAGAVGDEIESVALELTKSTYSMSEAKKILEEMRKRNKNLT